MNKILDNEGKFVLYDNVLDSETFKVIWKWVQSLKYTSVNSSGEFMKIWKLTDGNPMASQSWFHSNSPFNSPLDLIHAKCLELTTNHPKVFGDWKEIVFRSYIYGRGTKINWHNDPGYTAAAIFYTHPVWSAGWGGELQIAEVPEMEYNQDNIGGELEKLVDR
jgi:Rps23 Pro-64 3,4-dihydroxylase Tpa1-like proline 4-hydroxylase